MIDLRFIEEHLEKRLEVIEKQYKKYGDKPNFDYSYYLGFKDCLVSEIIYIKEKMGVI